MALFDRLDRMTSRTIDRAFASEFWLMPMVRTANGRPTTDDTREEVTGKGIFDQESEPSALEVGKRDREGNDMRSLVNGQSFQLSVDRHRYPTIDTARQ